jgi:acyl-CoA synthetase (AMP-forming)/AMP-acid ligase II
VLVAPAYHGAGMDWGLFPILWRAGTVIMPPEASFNPVTYFRLLREHSVEYALLVPATIGPLYRTWDRAPITTVKTLISTSAPTSPALREKLAEMFPQTNLLAGAGISESLNMAIQAPGDFLKYSAGIGEPHLDTRLCVVDVDGRELPRGQRGEICLRGFNTALYYHGNEDASRRTWRKRADDPEGLEWCFTGDVGVMDDDGRLSIVDRNKDIILTGGETVPSVEIENAFGGHARIRECAAVGLPDERWGEAITLVVVKSSPDEDDAVLARELFGFGRERLAGYKMPKQIAFIDALPRSHFGKLLKRELRHMTYRELHRPESAPAAPAPSHAS